MNHRIYADNAATTRIDPEVLEAMRQCALDHYANPSQLYSTARESKKVLESSRETIARCIGADPDEIYFTSGGSESNNWAVKGTFRSVGRHGIVTTPIEHHSVLRACESMRDRGEEVRHLDVNGEGTIRMGCAKNTIDASVRLVSSMLANNEVGTIEPVSEIGRMAHDSGALMHSDAVQAVGHLPVDVDDLGVDLLSASAHKFNGPHGIGFLYIREGVELDPLIHGGSQEKGIRAGTQNVPGALGMALALERNCADMERNRAHLQSLERRFVSVLDSSGLDYRRNGAAEHLPGLLSVSLRGMDGEALLHRLDLKGILVSTGSACNSISHETSHVLESISVDPDYIRGTIRVSFGKHNTMEDAVDVAEAIVEIVNKTLNRRSFCFGGSDSFDGPSEQMVPQVLDLDFAFGGGVRDLSEHFF